MAKYEVVVKYTTYEVMVVNAKTGTEARDIAIKTCPIVPDVESSAFSVEVIEHEELLP